MKRSFFGESARQPDGWSITLPGWHEGMTGRGTVDTEVMRSGPGSTSVGRWPGSRAQRTSSSGSRGGSARYQGRSSGAAPSQRMRLTQAPEATDSARPWPHQPTAQTMPASAHPLDGGQGIEHIADDAGPAPGHAHSGNLQPERPLELGGETIEGGLAAPAISVLPPQAVTRPAATEEDPVIAGQTEVVEDPPRIEDALAPLPAQRLEPCGASGRGDNHLQVHRQNAAAEQAERRRVAGRRHHDIVGTTSPPPRARDALAGARERRSRGAPSKIAPPRAITRSQRPERRRMG